jgi:hypothetical protein
MGSFPATPTVNAPFFDEDPFDPFPTTPKKVAPLKFELRASAPDFPKLAPPPSSGKSGHKRSMSANVRVNE